VSAPPTGPLELRLERLKCLSNLEFDFLKRLYDRRSIAELYRGSEQSLHIHFRTVSGYCATYRAGHIAEIGQMIPVNNVNCNFVIGLSRNERPVLIGVGQVSEDSRPLISTIRLQRLDSCHMRGIETVEPSSIYPPRKSLSLVFDRELSAINVESAVQNRQFIDQVIEGRSEIVTDFPDQDAKTMIQRAIAESW